VFDHAEFDRLTGSSDFGWLFFSLSEDEATDRKNNEK
jgi:hypothetical protein